MTSGNLFVPFLGDLQQKQRLKESLLSILDSCVATSDPAPTKQTPERPTISPLTPASTIDQSTSPAAQFLGPHHALRPAAQSSTNTPDLASPIPHATPLAPTSKVKKQPSTRLQLQPHDTCFTALKGVGKVLYVFDPNDIGERLCERTGLFKVMNRVEKTRSRARYDDSSSYPQSFSKKNVLETKPRVLFCACTKCTNGKKPVRAVCESFEVMCNKTLRLILISRLEGGYYNNNAAVVLGDMGGGEYRIWGLWKGASHGKGDDDMGKYSYDSPVVLRTESSAFGRQQKRRVSEAESDSIPVTPRKRKRGLPNTSLTTDPLDAAVRDDSDDDDYEPSQTGRRKRTLTPSTRLKQATSSPTPDPRCELCQEANAKCERDEYWQDRCKRCDEHTLECKRPPRTRVSTPFVAGADAPPPFITTPLAKKPENLTAAYKIAVKHVLHLELPSGDLLTKEKDSAVVTLLKSLEKAASDEHRWWFNTVWESIDEELEQRELQCLPARSKSLGTKLPVRASRRD